MSALTLDDLANLIKGIGEEIKLSKADVITKIDSLRSEIN